MSAPCRGLPWQPRAVLALLLLVSSSSARAEGVRFFDLEGFGHFLDGNPETTAITEDGGVALPPPTQERFADAAAVFSAATTLGDDVLVARVEDGQVIAVDRAGKSRNVYKAEETMVASLHASGGDLFVGTGSPGKIYRVGRDGKAELYYTADAQYVWSMTRGPEGALYASTGEPGTVVRIDGKGSGKVVFAPDQAHLRALTYDPKIGLLVGGGERGVVYRAATGTDFRALYDTGNPEVTAITTFNGMVYAAGVTGAQELADGAGKSGKGDGKKGPNVRSQLVRIALDGATETLAGSSDEAVFALAVDDKGQILVATGATGRDDPRGRIYSVEPERRVISLLFQSPSRRITHLVPLGKDGLCAVSAAGGRITQIGHGYARTGEFYTLPFDTGINSRFGIVQLFGDWPKATRVTAAVRSGQTGTPDASWSDWSAEVPAPGNARPKVPGGRYVQVRLTLAGEGGATPAVFRVRVAYLRQNLAPFVRELTVLPKGVALYAVPNEAAKSKVINLADTKPTTEDRRTEDDGPLPPTRARQVEEAGAISIRWVADDPNSDELHYRLEYRPAGRGDWRVLKDELQEPFYTLRSSQLPDGHYQFRVWVNDAASNPPGDERTDSRISRDVVIDNTPPRVDPLKVQLAGRRATVRGSFADAVGPLVSATFSLDAADARPLQVDDGVLDGPGESFTLTLPELASGTHTLTVRVRDEAQNEGVAEALISIP
jgi:hypothetical protein